MSLKERSASPCRRASALALGLLAAAGCRGGAGGGPQGPPPMPVKIEVARDVPLDDSSEYVASLRSRGSAEIRPEVEGRITAILVRAGARVQAGESLVQIDPAKQQATLKSQEDTRAARSASLAYARQQNERVKGLFEAGVASRQQLDEAQAALDAAQAELQSLEAQVREQQVQLRYYSVSAPMDGIVGDVPVRVGDRVTAATLLTTVDRAGALEAYVSVPVERAAQLRRGLPVRVLDSAGQLVAETEVGFVSPQVDDLTQTVLVKAPIPSERAGLRPAQFVRARIVWGTHSGPVVPVLAVQRIGGRHFAFVAEDQKGQLVARQRALKLGEIVGGNYVVLDGLKSGERLIVSGTQFLVDGAPVSPQG